jgi:hypothetical protein
MRTRSPYFVDQYNDLSAWKKRDKGLEQIKPVRMLKNATEIDLDKLPLTEGQVHFIRQVDGEGQINVLSEDLSGRGIYQRIRLVHGVHEKTEDGSLLSSTGSECCHVDKRIRLYTECGG